jgi:hypothetical protein
MPLILKLHSMYIHVRGGVDSGCRARDLHVRETALMHVVMYSSSGWRLAAHCWL